MGLEETGCEGKVILVGGGPGDPGLITVKGLEAIRRADVIVYDRLAPAGLLREARSEAVLIDVGKRPGEGPSQEEINRLLYEWACRGKLVVRLKGGDPLIYGRGEEECLYLMERGVECEVVPGVSSINAAAAAALAPLGSRLGSSVFAVAPGRTAGSGEPSLDYPGIARNVDTLVLLMAASTSGYIAERLLEALPPETPVVIVEKAAMEGERVIITDLDGLVKLGARGEIEAPAVIIIGGAAAVAAKAHSLKRGGRGSNPLRGEISD